MRVTIEPSAVDQDELKRLGIKFVPKQDAVSLESDNQAKDGIWFPQPISYNLRSLTSRLFGGKR